MKFYVAKRNEAEIARDENLIKLRWKVRNYIETYHLDWCEVKIFRVKDDKCHLIGKR